jgi:acyl-CoA hydrolase
MHPGVNGDWMDHFTIVRPEHLNHHGFLFGGILLKWVDEYAWITASLDFPQCTLVTIAMDDIQFKQRVLNGSILRFGIRPLTQGMTSVRYTVEVHADEPGADVEKKVFTTMVTFVRVNGDGQKTPLPPHETYRSLQRG